VPVETAMNFMPFGNPEIICPVSRPQPATSPSWVIAIVLSFAAEIVAGLSSSMSQVASFRAEMAEASGTLFLQHPADVF
jgi:hypothetical protein